ncbi:MAG: OmpH family outer membrane protein [Treponema sp.]|nr:OmpH family outer membrane protein [Treponema sp.]
MKKIFALFLIAFGFCAYAEQITKFGVVDTARVYNSYFRESEAVREYDRKRSEFQSEIEKYTEELKNLKKKQVEYSKKGEESNALRTQSEITKKTDFLVEYTNAKNIELQSMQKSMKNNDAFYRKLYDTLSKIAETGGYSMILSLQQGNGILWYSPSVDVTEQVIAALGNN